MTSLRPEPPDQDSEALLAAAGAGSEEAWRELIRRYWRRVYALARSRCHSDEAAEEVTQSVFVTLTERLGSGGYAERGRFESWLFRIAVNRVRDEMRRRMRRAGRTTDFAALDTVVAHGRASGVSGSVEREDRFASLRAALKTLGEADREIIELRHHAGLSFAQISDLLEEPMGTLLARHHRALRKVRDAMREMGVERES